MRAEFLGDRECKWRSQSTHWPREKFQAPPSFVLRHSEWSGLGQLLRHLDPEMALVRVGTLDLVHCHKRRQWRNWSRCGAAVFADA